MTTAGRLGLSDDPEHSDAIRIAVEDCFAIVDASSPDRLFAEGPLIANLGEAVGQLGQDWRFMWDLRQAEDVYWDVLDGYRSALKHWPQQTTTVLATPQNHVMVQEALGHLPGAQVISMRPRPLSGTWFPLDLFHDSYEMRVPDVEEQAIRMVSLEIPDSIEDDDIESLREEVELLGAVYDELLAERRAAVFDTFLRQIAEHSILTQVAISVTKDRVFVTPYHSHSLHNVPTREDELVLVRPGRVSGRHWRTFNAAITELERLLNEPTASESDLERLLVQHPLFLQGLNYQAVYSQVILPSGDGRSLRPDIIAEPVDSEWATLMELKLPSEPVLVGTPGRARLAHGIHSAVRQLREYSAFFDDRRAAKAVEDRYGFKCYRPRLVAIVGRDPRRFSPEETRRAMTSYPDVELITYDRLLHAARDLLLV